MTSENYDKRKIAQDWDHWERMIDSADEPVAVVDAGSVVHYCNKPFQELVPGVDIGHNFLQALNPLNPETWDDFMRAYTAEKALTMEFPARNGSGIRWLYARVVPMSSNGDPPCFFVNFHDITEHKNFDDELQRRDALLQRAERLGGLASWTWDFQENRVYWSDNLYRMVGIEPQSRTPDQGLIAQVTHPEDRERIERAHQAALKEDATAGVKEHQAEFRLVKVDGTHTTVHARVEVERDSGGNPTKMSGVFLDITERQQIQEELRIGKERWEFALENAGDGLWDWNPKTNEVFFSGRWKSMLGYEDQDIKSSGDEWSSRVHPEDLQRCNIELDRHFKGEVPSYHCEHRIRCKDGSYKWILARGKVIARDADGTPVRITGTHTDMTEIKQMELALISANDQLKQEHQKLEDKNIALRVVLAQIQDESNKIKQQIAQNMERIVKPNLVKLRAAIGERGRTQIDALESALAEVTSPFISEIEKQFINLTPREMEICNHVKNGLRSKEVADILNISPQTVEKFRQKIRKKLKIEGTSANLSTFLRSHSNEPNRHGKDKPPKH